MAYYEEKKSEYQRSLEAFEQKLKQDAQKRADMTTCEVGVPSRPDPSFIGGCFEGGELGRGKLTEGPNVPEGKWATSSGATSRSKAPAYDLCPMELEKAAINRFQYGIDHGHEKNNWRKGKDDPTYAQERMNHAVEHLKCANSGIGTWQDIEAVICNLAMLCWYKVWGTAVHQAFPHLFQNDTACDTQKFPDQGTHRI